MLESFLVALSVSILKYYAGLAQKNILEYLEDKKQLEEIEKKAEKYQKTIDAGVSREERRKAEDEALS
jgi:hypothetical protein